MSRQHLDRREHLPHYTEDASPSIEDASFSFALRGKPVKGKRQDTDLR